jgi:uncharacterized membrane protein
VKRPVWRRLRRRVEVVSLRWHARLDSDWADRSLPWILAGLLFLFTVGLALARNRMLEHGIGLANYTQAAWKISHGRPPELTVPGTHLLDLHGSFAFYPLAWATRFLPIQPTLLVAQAVALAYGTVPLWRLARRVALLRVGATTALVIAYGLHPVLQNLNLADFHPEVLAVPALLVLALRGLTGSSVRYGLAAVVAVAARADLALLVAAFGVLLVVRGRRVAGGLTTALALVWLLASLRVGDLGAGDGSALAPGAYAQLGDGVFDVLAHLVGHPVDTVERVVRRENFDLAVELLVPLGFLPLLSGRWLALVAPWFFFVAVADVPTDVRLTALAAPMLPFLVAGAAFGLVRLGRPTLERVSVPSRVVAALVLVALTFNVAWSVASPYAHPWSWGARYQADRARLDAVARIPDAAAVQATEGVLALVARRDVIELLRSSRDVVPGSSGIDALLIEVAALPPDDPLVEGPPPGFTTNYTAGGILLYERIPEAPG